MLRFAIRYFVLFLDYFIVPCRYIFVSTLRNVSRDCSDDSHTDSKDCRLFCICSIFILLSRESDESAVQARLGVASHLSTAP